MGKIWAKRMSKTIETTPILSLNKMYLCKVLWISSLQVKDINDNAFKFFTFTKDLVTGGSNFQRRYQEASSGCSNWIIENCFPDKAKLSMTILNNLNKRRYK